ncbi:DNA polymerase eta [Spodoptera frugiperda]|uniref:DNA polymerase eta n=1 Tax=Spodoptera frugiperda TaxID=7108 RepID=A0A9R0D0M2_SPOFR|nr:DNA polymerase eta [Spodoptera frugiperda]
MDKDNRVVVLIDMDCFYCQVEEKLNPELKGKPIAVVQYNPWQGGGIIAVNYVARARGVTRHMRGKEAKEKCPDIELPSVPCQRGKADISKYRDAGKEVARVLQKFTPLLERASIDEAYLDITAPVEARLNTLNVNSVHTDMMPNTFALGYDSVDEFLADVHTCGFENIEFDYEHAKRLLIGAVIVSEIRAAVYEETGYRCSAGIAHNKILAKLVCGMNKPNKQTILPKHCINLLYSTLPLKKVKHLGGKFGYTVCEVLKISNMGELQNFTEKQLQSKFDEKNGTWLYNIARGIDLEPVQAKFNPKSIGCCKNFKGKAALLKLESLQRWLKDLGDEIEDRLEQDAIENNRTPKQMVVSYSVQISDRDISSSRSYNFTPEDELCGELFSNKALELLLESSEGIKIKDCPSDMRLKAPIKFLGISVGKFEDNTEVKKTKKILDYFAAGASKDVTVKPKEGTKQEKINETSDTIKSEPKTNIGKDYIMQKFLQASQKPQVSESIMKDNVEQINQTTEPVLQSSLDKQESFFAKILNQNKYNPNISRVQQDVDLQKIRPTTPVCDVVACGENSNDSNYSGSTINDEINNSVALFEEDPTKVIRVKSIRELLTSSRLINEDPDSDTASEPEQKSNEVPPMVPRNEVPKAPQNESHSETYQCPDCNKAIAITEVAEHSDFHLALKLREEERQHVRTEIKERKEVKLKQNMESKKQQQTTKPEPVSSIASFLVKIDDNIPTEICSTCGKKVPLDKFGEHLDFHEAQKLSRELNKKTSPQFTGNSVKRKRKSNSPVKKNKMPCRPIDSFFR